MSFTLFAHFFVVLNLVFTSFSAYFYFDIAFFLTLVLTCICFYLVLISCHLSLSFFPFLSSFLSQSPSFPSFLPLLLLSWFFFCSYYMTPSLSIFLTVKSIKFLWLLMCKYSIIFVYSDIRTNCRVLGKKRNWVKRAKDGSLLGRIR